MNMTEADQIPEPGHFDNAQSAPSDAGSDTLDSQSQVVWSLGDTPSNNDSSADAIGVQLPSDSDDFSAAVLTEAPANMDHALHQLTTTIDLFDVPVLDFGDHHF